MVKRFADLFLESLIIVSPVIFLLTIALIAHVLCERREQKKLIYTVIKYGLWPTHGE